MSNYQLYSTNIKLSGQLKWDLVLDENLSISDFHISPVSKYVPFNKKIKENLLNYSHRENIKSFYKSISGHFFNECCNINSDSFYPEISNQPTQFDTTFESGCKRSMYSLYGKQFEVFCPIWIESIQKGHYLAFDFNLYGVSENGELNPMGYKRFKLKNNIYPYQNKFVKYLNDYMEYIGVFEGSSDNLRNIEKHLKVDFENGGASLYGVNVETGMLSIYNLPHLVPNLLNRERPMMEFDNALIQEFENHKTIIKPLFNLSFHFNFGDIFSDFLTTEFIGKKFGLDVSVVILNDDDEVVENLEKVDFYNNYEYIPKKKCLDSTFICQQKEHNETSFEIVENKSQETETFNVLSYLRDNECVDLINKNKLTQSIIHWSLFDNNEYIFNLYNGFAGVIESNNVRLSHIYNDSPNLDKKDFDVFMNNHNWCNSINITDGAKPIYDNITNGKPDEELEILKNYFSDFNQPWIHNIKYKKEGSNNIYILYLVDKKRDSDPELFIYEKLTDIYCLIKSNQNVTYKNCLELLYNKAESDTNAKKVINRLKNIILPSFISTFYTIDIGKADGPSLDCTEIEYYKNNIDHSPYLERYFGFIKPTFISRDSLYYNFVYKTKNIEHDKLDKYRYLNEDNPVFPSIGHYYLEKQKKQYNPNINLCLYESLLINIEINDSEINNVDDLILKNLKNIYNLDTIQETMKVLSEYDISINFDYVGDGISMYKYEVKLTLK